MRTRLLSRTHFVFVGLWPLLLLIAQVGKTADGPNSYSMNSAQVTHMMSATDRSIGGHSIHTHSTIFRLVGSFPDRTPTKFWGFTGILPGESPGECSAYRCAPKIMMSLRKAISR